MKKSIFIIALFMLLSSAVFGQTGMSVLIKNYNPSTSKTLKVNPQVTVSVIWTLANGTRYTNAVTVLNTPIDGSDIPVFVPFNGTFPESFNVVKTCGSASVNIPGIMVCSRAICADEFIDRIILSNWVNGTATSCILCLETMETD
ncbi:MAG: hypothetical protein LBP67_06565 [Bacteroidales bacterium]|jgi:hypothetical protein|nr:hypothetical protein [Bacteroidales bacterium]